MEKTLTKLIILTTLFFSAPIISAERSNPGDLILSEIQKGGLVLYLRHAHADVGKDGGDLFWKDCNKQRQLSQKGIIQAGTIGAYLRYFDVPVGKVVTSELCRAKNTALHMGYEDYQIDVGLSDFHTWISQDKPREKLVPGYRKLLSDFPKDGSNTLLISHAQRGKYSAHPVLDLIEMGTLAVFKNNQSSGFELIATIRSTDWKYLGKTQLPDI